MRFAPPASPSRPAGVATLLIALHPAMLAACLGGAAEMCLVAFLYLLGNALFDLRARTAAREVMAVGLALLGLAFSHPIGAAIDVALVPLLLFAVRPALMANAALNVIFALVFPTIFALGAFAYVSWVFPGSGWSFLAAPAESLAGWAAVFPAFTGSLTLNASVAVAAALALGAPLAPVTIHMVRERRPLFVPPLVFAGGVVGAAAITVATGFFGNPAPLVAAAPVLAAVIVARMPLIRERRRLALSLLVAGWIGGLLAVAVVDPRVGRCSFGPPLTAALPNPSRLDSLALGGVTLTRDGVLIDTDNAPAVVLGRGRAHGLIGAAESELRAGAAVRSARCALRRGARPAQHDRHPRPAQQGIPAALPRWRRRLPARLPQQDLAALRSASHQQESDHANPHRRQLRRLARPHRSRVDGGRLRAGRDREIRGRSLQRARRRRPAAAAAPRRST